MVKKKIILGLILGEEIFGLKAKNVLVFEVCFFKVYGILRKNKDQKCLFRIRIVLKNLFEFEFIQRIF